MENYVVYHKENNKILQDGIEQKLKKWEKDHISRWKNLLSQKY